MRIYNRYIIWLTLLFTVTTVVLSTSNHGLDVYFSVYLIEYLAVTLLFSRLSSSALAGLNRIGYLLFLGFLFLVVAKVAEIITGVEVL